MKKIQGKYSFHVVRTENVSFVQEYLSFLYAKRYSIRGGEEMVLAIDIIEILKLWFG